MIPAKVFPWMIFLFSLSVFFCRLFVPNTTAVHAAAAGRQQIAGDLREGNKHLQIAKEIDPGLNQDDSSYGIAFFNREQLDISLKSSDCEGILVYGKKVLSVDPSDTETSNAVAACTARKSSKQGP